MTQGTVRDPSQAVPPPPIEPSSGGGCGSKVPGCVFGCLIAVGVVLVVAAAVSWWFFGPGTQHPTEAAVGPESSGAFQVRDLGADDGVREALDEVLREAGRRAPGSQQSPRPLWLPTGEVRSSAASLSKVLPREGTLSLERVPGREEPAVVVVLNLRGFTRPLRMFLERGDGATESYRGVSVVVDEGDDLHFAMVDGTLVVAEGGDALRATIDRLLDGTGEPVASRLEVLEQPPEGALLSGGFEVEPGDLAPSPGQARGEGEEATDEPVVDPADFEGMRRVELMVDDVDPRAIHFRVGVAAESPAAAERATAAVADLLRAQLEPAVLGVTQRTEGSSGVLEIELTEWIGPVADWLVRDREEEGSP